MAHGSAATHHWAKNILALCPENVLPLAARPHSAMVYTPGYTTFYQKCHLYAKWATLSLSFGSVNVNFTPLRMY